jgi:uracil-DNA glycosylase
VLDQALEAAALTRRDIYITNAVKHFKWEPRGKRRLHKKPDVGEIKACNIWLDQEIRSIQPKVIVALGTTALRAEGERAAELRSILIGDLRRARGFLQ